VSCASCHDPKFAFTDGAATSTGIKGQKGGRSAPTIINRAYTLAQFWDGRSPTLEDQAKGPMANPIEMGNTHDAIVTKIKAVAGYRPLFAKAFGSEQIDIDRIAMAIANFERTVFSGNAPYDKYKRGIKTAMTPDQVRGMTVFFDKAKCDRCHEGANFTLNMFANLGVGADKPEPDVGRFAVTKNPAHWGQFKTPTLREIEKTGPYMHDGSLKTLEEVGVLQQRRDCEQESRRQHEASESDRPGEEGPGSVHEGFERRGLAERQGSRNVSSVVTRGRRIPPAPPYPKAAGSPCSSAR
jgi:cytochrome c peroxidase